jgi:hypothetical protein
MRTDQGIVGTHILLCGHPQRNTKTKQRLCCASASFQPRGLSLRRAAIAKPGGILCT